ncbi:MAG: hypothetical protein AB7I18_09085 [Candidatus Berkiella sp.]
MPSLTNKIFISAVLSTLIGLGSANAAPSRATLHFSDNREAVADLNKINDVLHTVGVHLSQVEVPHEAVNIIKNAGKSKLDDKQQARLLKIMALNHEGVLAQVKLAGRKPVIAGGGSLSTQEIGVPPYPKIYDMHAMTANDHIQAENKFGKLHVNYAENGQGVDEVMTLISGGPWTWFFAIDNNVVVKLTMDSVNASDLAWRISYPGKVPHGAFMDATDGICVAYITGPQTWLMRYEATQLPGAQMLGTNPWIDFSGQQPILLKQAKR